MPIALGLPFLLALPAWRTGLRRAALVAGGLALVLAPWTIRNLVTHGSTGADGALGQALIGRTVRHDKGFRFDDPASPDPDPTRAAARRIIQQEADGGEPSGGTITARVRDELGLSQAQTSALLRELALAEIAERPGHYLASTGEMAWELFQGRNERLLGNWRQRTTRNWDRKWDPRIVALLDPDTPAEGEPYERADAVTSFFQPWRWRTPITWLFGDRDGAGAGGAPFPAGPGPRCDGPRAGRGGGGVRRARLALPLPRRSGHRSGGGRRPVRPAGFGLDGARPLSSPAERSSASSASGPAGRADDARE